MLFAEPPWDESMPADLRAGRGHGRAELRLLRWSAALSGYTDWPGFGGACMVRRVVTRQGRTTYEESYAAASLTPARRSAAQIQRVWRGRRGIETRLHWARDVTFGEDLCQVRTGSGPQGLATVRNLVIGVLRRAGHATIAAALRTDAAAPARALALLGLAL